MVNILPFGLWENLAIAITAGLFVGYVLPPLSQHTASMHMGYSLFNVGFSGGTLAFVMFCVLKSFGIESQPVFIWKAEQHPKLIIGVYLYLLAAFLLGTCRKRRSGRTGTAVSSWDDGR